MHNTTCPHCGALLNVCLTEAEVTFEPAKTPLEASVSEQGYVKNNRLFRRWIMSQVFHNLALCEGRGMSYTEAIRNRGLRYMWHTVYNEVRKMHVINGDGDIAEASRRSMWWNGGTLQGIFSEFIQAVKDGILELKVRRCKKRPYKDIPGMGWVFLDDIEEQVIHPLESLLDECKNNGYHPASVLKFCRFANKFKEHRSWGVKMPNAFINAYKGAGAYYTMRNMIMFHGCRIDKSKSVEENLSALDAKANECVVNGTEWKMHGLLKALLKSNGIDITKKISEWRKR